MVLATERVIHHPPPPSRPAHATVTGASTTSSSSSFTDSHPAVEGMRAGVQQQQHPSPLVRQQEEEETVTLLRRAVERKDRAVVDGIVRVRANQGGSMGFVGVGAWWYEQASGTLDSIAPPPSFGCAITGLSINRPIDSLFYIININHYPI